MSSFAEISRGLTSAAGSGRLGTSGGKYIQNATALRVDLYLNKDDLNAVLNRKLGPYKSIPTFIKKPLEQIGQYIRYEVIPTRFKNEGQPGRPWKELSQKTLDWRYYMGGYRAENAKILQPHIDFPTLETRATDFIHMKASGGVVPRLRIWSSDWKVIVHQKGTRLMPKRPFIPETWGDYYHWEQDHILGIIDDHLAVKTGEKEKLSGGLEQQMGKARAVLGKWGRIG